MPSSICKTLIKRSIYSHAGGGGGGGEVAVLLGRRILISTIPLFSPFSTSAAANNLPEGSPSSSSYQSQDKERRTWSNLLLFIPGAITFGLGTWQIFRRQDKVKMLEYRQKRLATSPIHLNAVSTADNVESLEFRRVLCKGVFDEKRSIFVGPRSRSISGVTENGYYVITPLMPVPGNPESIQSPVLVNRGWVPRSWRDDFFVVSKQGGQNLQPSTTLQTERSPWWKIWSKKSEKKEDEASQSDPLKEVVGVVRGSENPSIFVPANDPNSGQWFYVDVPAFARACGLPQNTIYMEETDDNSNPSNPYPVPKDVNTLIHSSVMPQDHLNYTFTWYSLSAAVTFMAYKRLKPTRRRV